MRWFLSFIMVIQLNPPLPPTMPTPLPDAASDAASHAAPFPVGDSSPAHGHLPFLRTASGVPIDEGAKVKMGLYDLSTDALIPYIENHIRMMTGNPNFAMPQPPPEDFLADFNAYQNAAMAVLNLEAMLRDAMALREQMRGVMVGTMNVRAAYVQQASNGNRQVITSSGLGVKSAPTYVTSLAAPTNLRVELNGEAGLMKIRWNGVPHARTYLLQYRRNETPDAWETLESTTKTTVTKTLEVGVTYVFRVSANGTPGMSNWSAETIRGAA